MPQEKTTKLRLGFFKEDISKPFFIAIILTVAGIGIIFRSTGLNNCLWLDEAMWAQKLVNNPLIHVGFIRPIGFLAITKLLISIKNSEVTLRLIPYLSSIIAIVLMYLIAKEIFKSKLTILISVFLVSFNPILISFAKEFKPYSNEFSIHLLIILVMVLYINKKVSFKFYHIFGILFVVSPFAYNIGFLYPSVFLLLLLAAYQKENFKEFLTITSLLCLGLAGMLLFYFLFWQGRTSTTGAREVFWGRKYDVFFLSTDLIKRAEWIIRKYLGLIWSSGRAEVFWDFFSIKYEVSSTISRISFLADTVEDRIINVALLVLHSIGLVSLFFRKRINYILIFVLPIFVVILFNIIGIWPFGPFRVNLFLFSYFLIISLHGLDVITSTPSRRLNWCTTLFTLTILIFLQLPIKPQYFTLKIGDNPGIKSLLNTMFSMEPFDRSHEHKKQPRIIMAEGHSYFPIKYYMENHSEFSKKYEKILNNYEIVRVRRLREITDVISTLPRDSLNKDEPVWIMNSNHRDFNRLDNYLVKDNFIFHKTCRESELIYYLPHSVANIFTFNDESGFGGIRGLAHMDLRTEMRNRMEVLIATATGKDSCLELPNIRYPEDKFLSISAHIESPAKTDFRIFYMTEMEKQYTDSNSITFWLDYGKNTLGAIINDKNVYGEIRICPGRVPGDYVISEIEISAVDN